MSKFVLTAQLQLQAPSNVGQVVKQIQNQLNSVNVSVKAKGAAQATKQVQGLSKALTQADKASYKLGKTFTSSLKRFAAFSVATRAVSLLTQGLGGAISEAIAFERELMKVAQVTGRTLGQLKGLTDEITKLATSLGVSSKELLNVSRALSQAGFSAYETKIALDALAKSSLAPTFEDMAKTAEGAIAIFNQFGKGAAALEGQLGAINAVAGRFAVEAGDLIAVIRRTGGVFKAAGGDLNELIALFTSVRSTTRESAESIATGLRTIFTRIQRPRTIQFLKEMGVSLTDVEGKFVGPFEAVKRLSAALSGLEAGDLRFVKIAEQLGGFRQIGKVIPLLQQFAVAQEAYNVALGGSASLAADAEKAQGSLAVKVQKLKEEWLALIRGFTDSTGFKVMTSAALNLATAIIKMLDALKDVLPIMLAMASVKMFKGMGGFMAGAKSGAMGSVPKFASGGVVPGSGNRDTVPAMLTPGEFVIRKSSVKKMGSENLKSMNAKGYAGGGPVAQVKLKDSTVGGFFLIPSKGENQDTNTTYKGKKQPPLTNRSVIPNLKAGAVGSTLGGASGSKDSVFGKMGAKEQHAYVVANFPEGHEIHKHAASLPGKTSKIWGGPKGLAPKVVGDAMKGLFASNPQAKADMRAAAAPAKVSYPTELSGKMSGMILGSSRVKGVKGAKGKGGKQSLTADVADAVRRESKDALKIAVKNISADPSLAAVMKPITASGGQGITPNKAELNDALKNLYTDKPGGAVDTIEGFVQEGLVASLTGAKIGGTTEGFDFPDLSTSREQLKKLYGGEGLGELVKADAKRSGSQWPKIAAKAINDINKHGAASGILESVKIREMAKGGPAGTDTVPALLTPGEFVVNAKSAQSIGHANLNSMNKKGVSKFAAGGIVGPKKFAGGGGVGKAEMGMMGMMMVLPMIQSSFEAIAGQSDLMSDSFAAVGTGLTSFMGAMMPMNMIMAGWDKDLEKGGNDLKEMGAQAGDAIEAGLSALNITTITITAKIVNLTGTINMAGGGGGGGGLGSAAAGMSMVVSGQAATKTAAATATIQKEGIKGGGGGGDVKSAKMTIATAKLKVESATAKKVKIESAGKVKIESAAAVTFKTVSTISIKGKVTINAASVKVKGGGKVDAPAAKVDAPAAKVGSGAKFEPVDTLPPPSGGGGRGQTVDAVPKKPIGIPMKPQVTSEMEAAAKGAIDPKQVKSAKPKSKPPARLEEDTGLSDLKNLKGIKTDAEAKLATEQGALDKHTADNKGRRKGGVGMEAEGRDEVRLGNRDASSAATEAKAIQTERDELAKGSGNKSKSGRRKRVKATLALDQRASANQAKAEAAEQRIAGGQRIADEGSRAVTGIDAETARLTGVRDKTAKGLTGINENIAGREAARTQPKPMLAGTGSPKQRADLNKISSSLGPATADGVPKRQLSPKQAALMSPKPVMSRYDAARTPEAAAMRARGEHPSIIGTPDKRSPARQALESRELVRETAPRPAGPGLPTRVPTGTVIGSEPHKPAGRPITPPPGAVPPGAPPSQRPVKPVGWKKLNIEQKKAVIATKLMSRSMNKSGIKKSLQNMRIGIRKMSPALFKFGRGVGRAIKSLKKMSVGGAVKGLGKAVGKLGPVFKGVADAAKKFVDAQFNRSLAKGDINLSDFDKSNDNVGGEGAGVTGAEALVRQKLSTDKLASRAGGAMSGMMAGGMALGPIGAIGGAIVGAYQEEIMGGLGAMMSDGFSLENFQKGAGDVAIKKEEALMSQIGQENLARFQTELPDLMKDVEKGRGDEFSVGEMAKGFKAAQMSIDAIEKTDPKAAKAAQKATDKGAVAAAAAIGGQVRSQAELEARINTLTAAYGNNAEEVRNAAKAAFAAAEALRAVATIKADILVVTSIFGAANLAVGNFTSSLVTGSNSMTATVNTLKEAQKNIALGKGGKDAVKKARDEVMSRSGIDPTSEAGQAINRQFDVLNQAAEVTSQLPKVLKDTKVSLGSNPTEVRTQLTESLTDSMGIDQDSQMGKIIAGEIGKLTDNQIADIQSGKLDLSTVLGNIGPEIAKLGEGALKAAEALQKHEATIIKMTQQRMKMEADLLKAQQKAIDLHMEAAKIAAKHGGRNLTANQKRQAIMDKANLSARSAGVRGLGGTTGGDIRTMSARMTQQSGMQSFRAQLPGAFEGPQGLDADKRQKLAKAQQDLIKTTKELIKVEQEELKISKEKNRLERQSLEALLGGDVEGFMKGQGARGATSAVASGSATLMSMFGADEMAGAFKNVQQMQKAGVGSFGGMDINTLVGATGSQALGMRGIHDASSAAVLTGQTAEENAANARIRDLAGGLSSIGENAAQMAEMEVNTANININNANVKFKTEVGRAASQFARGGPVYANAGMFIPRGTDTVPAMLTPGEFVINRASVNRGNNLQILRAINSGASDGAAQAMSGGGSVGYYHKGGGVGGGLNSDLIDKLSTGLRNFNTQLKENIDRLQKTKFQIKLDTTNVNVTLNSGGFLRKLKKEVKAELLAEVGDRLRNLKFTNSGDAVENKGVLTPS